MKSINKYIQESLIKQDTKLRSIDNVEKIIVYPQSEITQRILSNFIKGKNCIKIETGVKNWSIYVIDNIYIEKLKTVLLNSSSDGWRLKCVQMVKIPENLKIKDIELNVKNLKNYDDILKYIRNIEKNS